MDERRRKIYLSTLDSLCNTLSSTCYVLPQFFPTLQSQSAYLLIWGRWLAQTALGWQETEDSPATAPRGNPRTTCSLQERWKENKKWEQQAEAITSQGKPWRYISCFLLVKMSPESKVCCISIRRTQDRLHHQVWKHTPFKHVKWCNALQCSFVKMSGGTVYW